MNAAMTPPFRRELCLSPSPFYSSSQHANTEDSLVFRVVLRIMLYLLNPPESVRCVALLVLLFLIYVVPLPAYLYFSSPGRVVVNELGEIEGRLNKARAFLQGKAFWQDQLAEVTTEIRRQENLPKERAELWAIMTEALAQAHRKVAESMQETYREHPHLQPSPAKQAAERMRQEADRIEQAEALLLLTQKCRERIAELKRVLPLVKARAE